MSFEATSEATTHVNFVLNGQPVEREVRGRELLVTFIRDQIGLTGTHIGCDSTNCGCCSVLLDGRVVKSCTVLAVQVDGRSVVTMEGLSPEGQLNALQEAFVQEHGLQCGYCTPGMVMCATDLLRRNPDPTDEDIRAALAGNLCRCTGYAPIKRAIHRAAEKLREEGGSI